jgi:hypothetical protein
VERSRPGWPKQKAFNRKRRKRRLLGRGFHRQADEQRTLGLPLAELHFDQAASEIGSDQRVGNFNAEAAEVRGVGKEPGNGLTADGAEFADGKKAANEIGANRR